MGRRVGTMAEETRLARRAVYRKITGTSQRVHLTREMAARGAVVPLSVRDSVSPSPSCSAAHLTRHAISTTHVFSFLIPPTRTHLRPRMLTRHLSRSYC